MGRADKAETQLQPDRRSRFNVYVENKQILRRYVVLVSLAGNVFGCRLLRGSFIAQIREVNYIKL